MLTCAFVEDGSLIPGPIDFLDGLAPVKTASLK